MATSDSENKKKSETLKEKEKIDFSRGTKVETLLSWKAPARPFQKKSKEFYSTVAAIAFLVGIILLFLKEWFLILVIIALCFFVYILSTTPPEEVEHKITNRGIETAERNFNWDQLGSFWFSEQSGQKVLNIVTPFQFPGRLILLLGKQDEKEIKEILSRFIEYEEIKPRPIDKAGKWLSDKIDLGESPQEKKTTSD